jgi:transposase InsO family protein
MPGANRSELARRFGVSRTNLYKWLDRFELHGESGLEECSRRPLRSPTRTPEAMEGEVLRVRKESEGAWGGRKIAHVLRGEGFSDVPSASTVTEILRRHGKLEASAGEHPGPCQRFEREAPNELWQMDFKGHFQLLKGRCHPLTVLDDHSRFALALEACGDEQARTVQERLIRVFRRYGMPLAILADNGPPWASPYGPSTILTIWLHRLGVRVAHGRPFHPQTQGKDERFHRTIGAEVLNGRSFADRALCQVAFDRFRHRYNHRRPHQALGMATPATRYRISPRSYPEQLPAIEYADGDIVRKVDSDGYISFRNRPWRIGHPFKKQPVALRPGRKDGEFIVYFCVQPIRTIDLHDPAGGVVDSAAALPTTPPAQQQQPQGAE